MGAEHTQWSVYWEAFPWAHLGAPLQPLATSRFVFLSLSQSTAAGRVSAATRRLCYARELLSPLPRAVTTLSSRSRLRQVPPHPFLYPTACSPTAPGTSAPRRAKGALLERPHPSVPKPAAGGKGAPEGPSARRSHRSRWGASGFPAPGGTRNRPSPVAPTRTRGCVILSMKSVNKHPRSPPSSPNPNYPPRTSGCAHQLACFSGSYPPSSLPFFPSHLT